MIPAPEPTVTKQVVEATGKTPRRVSILDNAVCVRVKFGKIGTSRKVKNSTKTVKNEETGEDVVTKTITIDAEEDLIKVSKKLLDSPEMKAINNHYSAVRKWMKMRINASNIDDGLYWIGIGPGGTTIKEFDQGMERLVADLDPLLDALAEAFEGIVQEDAERLRAAFDLNDYPPVDKVKEAFKISWRYIAFTTPRSLEAVSEELFKKAQDELNLTIQTAQSAVELALREEVMELVSWASDRLATGDDGKRKRLRTKNKDGEEIGLTARLHEFFETFRGRNITSDAELEALVNRAEAIMTGVDGDAIKSSDTLRENLKKEFDEIKVQLEPLVENSPRRMIDV